MKETQHKFNNESTILNLRPLSCVETHMFLCLVIRQHGNIVYMMIATSDWFLQAFAEP